MNSTIDFTYADLANSKEFGELHRIITDFTGVVMGLENADEKDARPCSPSKFNPVCRIIRTTQEGCNRCHETDVTHINQALSESKGCCYVCHAGMVDFAVPVVIQGKNIGVINCGQIFSSPPTEEGFAKLQEKLSDLDLDEKELREAYFQTPYMPQDKIESLLDLLTFLSGYFCEVGMRLKETQKDQKYPEIARAKNFIKEHFREPLSLKTVADHTLLSENYFCGLFHRTVGVTFSQYLQMVRLEEAKKLLSQTDWPISQIALSAGFSSLSYFNQIFRKIEACTPRQYRAEHQEEAT